MMLQSCFMVVITRLLFLLTLLSEGISFKHSSPMLSEENQIHLIKTVISLKKISITVRFPCSISFALKHQSNIVDHKAVYELIKGECNINKSIEIELEVPFFRGRYEDRKVSLLIYMVSSNGKIPAGTVTLNPTEKLLLDKRAPLEKCPDKNAYAVYTESFEKVKILGDNTEKGRLSNLASSTISGYNQLRRSGTQLRTSAHRRQQKQVQEEINNQITVISPRNEVNRSDIKLIDSKELKESLIASGSQKKLNTPRPPRLRLDNLPRKSSFETIDKAAESRRSINESQAGLQEWEVQAQKTKIMKLQQERASYIKQISKLRGSLVRVQSQQRIELQGEINRVKDANDNLEDELRKLRDKSRNHQKKERQSSGLMRELRQQLDKKKSKIFQLDSSRHKIEGQLSEKDKMIAILQSEKKKLQEALQEEKSLQASIQKRMDIKENSYKDQLKKINERLTQIDTERQKSVFDYSNLLNEFESSQKKHQIVLREKDKAFNEQRIKINKRNEQLSVEIASLSQKVNQNYNSLRDYEYFKKKYEQQEMENRLKINNLKDLNESLQNQNKQLKSQNKGIQNQLHQIQQAFTAEKGNYKKKFNELTQELQICKEKIQKLQSIILTNDASIKDLQSKLQRQIKEKNISNSKIQEMIRIQQKLAQDEDAKQKLLQTISVQNINHNQKLNDFKSRLESQRKKFESMEAKYEEQVKYLVCSKEYLQNQIEELKWQLQKQLQKFEVLNIKHRQLGDKVMDLSQLVVSFQEQVTSFQELKRQKQLLIKQLKTNISDHQETIKKIEENYKKKETQYSNLEKKCRIYEQQKVYHQEKCESNDILHKQNSQNTQKNIDQLKNLLRQRDFQLEKTRNDLQGVKSEHERFYLEIRKQAEEIHTLNQANKTLKNDYNTIISRYDSARSESQQLKKKLNLLQESSQQFQQQLTVSNNSYEKMKLQFDEYKNANARCLEQFFIFIGNQDDDPSNQVSFMHFLPDERLSSLQIESLRKHQAIRKRLEEQSVQIKKSAQYLENQLVKLQAYIQKIEEEHVKYIIKSQEELTTIKQERNITISQLQRKFKEISVRCEEYKNEIQYFNGQVIKYEQTISNITQQVQAKRSKQGILSNQVHRLEQELFDIKEKQVKQKLLFTSEASELKQILILQREHHTQIANSLKAEIIDKERQISEKAEDIKRWILNQSDYKIQITKMAEDTKELNKKIEEQRQGKMMLQRSLKDKERLLKQLDEQISGFRKQDDRLKQMIFVKEQKIQHIQTDYSNLQLKFNHFKEDERVKIMNLEENVKKQRQKGQKMEALKLKLQQQNKQVRQKCVRLESENQFYKFFKAQSTKKLEQYQKIKEQTFKELIKCKQAALRAEKQIVNYQNKYYKMEMEIQNLNKQKLENEQTNKKIQQSLAESEQTINNLHQVVNELQSRERENKRLQQTTKSIQFKHERNLTDLRAQISKLAEQSNLKSDRIKELEQEIQNSVNELNAEKEKWQVELDNQKNIFQLKLETLDENIGALQNQLEFQKEQSVKEIEGANGIIQELNEVIREKEEMLEYKGEVISEQTVRLEQLNLQLAECLAKWEKEKETYMPTAAKMTEFREEMTRMNTFIGDLDGRNRQLLEINKRKMQQGVQNKPSFTETLKELYVLMQKNKNKILNRCVNEKEREAVIGQFKALQEKLDLTLKSPQIVAVKQ